MKKYSSWEEASTAARSLGISTSTEYNEKYKLDARLPACPNEKYMDVWKVRGGMKGFLGVNTKYLTVEDAAAAARRLGIKTSIEYKSRYKEDSKLPSSPWLHYLDFRVKYPSMSHFLGSKKIEKYECYFAAKEAVRNLGIKSYPEYKSRYSEDPRLPSNPNKFYKDEWSENGKWNGFFDNAQEYYGNISVFIDAVRKLEIYSEKQYFKEYKKDKKLPPNPKIFYGKLWDDFGGNEAIFPGSRRFLHLSLDEAAEIIGRMGITNINEYRDVVKSDPRFVGRPDKKYADVWDEKGGWDYYLGREKKPGKYASFDEASAAVRRLKILKRGEYHKRWREDPKLPRLPWDFYKNEWEEKGGWRKFSGNWDFYDSFHEAAKVVKSLKISSIEEYSRRYAEDPRLPSAPWERYRKKWDELGPDAYFYRADEKSISRKKYYEKVKDAAEAAQKLGAINRSEYLKCYTLDSGLYIRPDELYANQIKGEFDWKKFLSPTVIDSLEKFKSVIRILGVRSAKEYHSKYKGYKFASLPRNPERVAPLCHLWKGWKFVLDIEFYTYQELKEIIEKENISTQMEYGKFRVKSNDKRIPASPHEHYDEWTNWHQFTGREEPFKPGFISEAYSAWRDDFEKFIDVTPGSGHKDTSLCRFQRNFIQKNSLGVSVDEFLTTHCPINKPFEEIKKIISLYSSFLESSFSEDQDNSKYKTNQAVNEFIEFIIEERFTVEGDDNDGHSVRLVRNPFGVLSVGRSDTRNDGESNKPILPYHYVKDAREWIIPIDAKSFSDLTHLYDGYDSDWIAVDELILDENDPDCVFETRTLASGKEQAYIWCPLPWIHTYALLHTPFRGGQIAFNDSGEADEYIPVLGDDERIYWELNSSTMAGLTKNQSFIKRYQNDELGSYCTTNKTSTNSGGHSVPWIDLDLAKWIIRFRNWQSKYNPINTPTPWTSIPKTRSNLNLSQKKSRGVNCFLFRGFKEVIPKTFSNYLASRLAVALYNIQDEGIELAACVSEKQRSTYCYSSDFTPHSIRASLITAFLMDFGLDIHVVMKLVGHHSIVMTAYYNKPGAQRLRDVISAGEKRVLKERSYYEMREIQKGRVELIKNNLVSSSEDVLSSLSAGTSPTSYSFTDYGFCPFAGARCHEGGPEIEKTKIRSPVPEGYLGVQNCVRCRFFVTGPAFLGGLLALCNEIFLAIKKQSEHVDRISGVLNEVKNELRIIDEEEFDLVQAGRNPASDNLRFDVATKKNRINAELERATKKLDMYLCDAQGVMKSINQCKNVINRSDSENGRENIQLIKSDSYEISFSAEEDGGYFRQLCEVCENAEIFESSDALLAITPRTQMLDRMGELNGFRLDLFMLNEQEQLRVGNQMSNLIVSRLKSWGQIERLMNGDLYLSDFQGGDEIDPSEFLQLINKSKGLKVEGNRRLIESVEVEEETV